MIDPLYFGIGFIVYVFFTVLTFDIFSRRKGETNIFILIFIYIYYSILAVYLINFVERGLSEILVYEYSIFEVIIQSMIYLVACAIYVSYYYKSTIRKRDKQEVMNESYSKINDYF